MGKVFLSLVARLFSPLFSQAMPGTLKSGREARARELHLRAAIAQSSPPSPLQGTAVTDFSPPIFPLRKASSLSASLFLMGFGFPLSRLFYQFPFPFFLATGHEKCLT